MDLVPRNIAQWVALLSWGVLNTLGLARGLASEAGISGSGEAGAFVVPARWEYSAPLIAPEKRDKDPSRAQKDPTIVFVDGKWHVFMTVKLPGRSAIEPWTDNVSHGELIRDGFDEHLTVHPDHLRFVFQGMLDANKAGNSYGQFQWRIGLLTPISVEQR